MTALSLALEFGHKAYPDWVGDEVIYDLVCDLIDDPSKVILLYEDKGFLAGITHNFLLGPHRMAVELGWYVQPEYRGEKIGKALIDGFENWAEVMDCKLITMVSIDEEMGKYYEKRGYKLYERSYMKEL